jgi:hypothetical protein
LSNFEDKLKAFLTKRQTIIFYECLVAREGSKTKNSDFGQIGKITQPLKNSVTITERKKKFHLNDPLQGLEHPLNKNPNRFLKSKA